MKQTKLTLLLGCAVIVGGCFIAYSPAIKGPFLWDDHKYITGNTLLSAPDGLKRIWFSTDVPSQYFPLVYTTFRFEYQMWQLNPIGYHVVNIALHVISSLLLWLILRRLSIPAAFVAAAAFALHPVNVESVAWITERKNTLMLAFALLSVLFYVEFALRSPGTRRSVFFYVLSLLCFALSLFSKTTACVLPIVLVLILWFKEVPLNARRILQVVPFFLLGLAMGLLTMWWEYHHQGVDVVDLGMGPLQKVLIATRAIWFYAGKVFWPVNLVFSYPRWNIDPADPFQYRWLIACLLVAAGLILSRQSFGRGPIAAILFFVVVLFPMIGVFQLYYFEYTWVADHYDYAAMIGLIMLVAAGGVKLFSRFGKTGESLDIIAAGVVLLTMGTLTWRQAGLYASPEGIWRDTLKKNPDSWLASNNLGQILLLENKLDEAVVQIKHSLELGRLAPVGHPHDIAAAHFNLAIVYRSQKKYGEAITQLQETLKIDPNDAEAHYDLGYLLESLGRLDEAAAHYNEALRIGPDVAMLHYRLAKVFLGQGNILFAIDQLHRALDISPDYVPALEELVDIFVTRDDFDIRSRTKIDEYLQRAAEKTGRQNPFILNMQAVVYAAEMKFEEAITTAQEALKLATDTGANDLAELIISEIQSYEKQLKSPSPGGS